MSTDLPRPHRTLRSALLDLAAAALLLVVPFTVFVRHHGYSVFRPEILICVAAIAAIGVTCGVLMTLGGTPIRVLMTALLVTLFVDFHSPWFDSWNVQLIGTFAATLLLGCLLRRHLSEIVAVTFAVLLLGAFFQGPAADHTEHAASSVTDSTARAGLAPLVHIILDEQIGLDGIPRQFDPNGELTSSLRKFYLNRGFRVFGKAFSRYASTARSISHLLNYAAEPAPSKYAFEFRPERYLKANAYFEEMSERGYEIHVYQTDFIDFCRGTSSASIASCFTTPLETIKSIEQSELAERAKIRIITGMFLRLSFLASELRNAYSVVQQSAVDRGFVQPNRAQCISFISCSPTALTHTTERAGCNQIRGGG
jgi:hypothetical protein